MFLAGFGLKNVFELHSSRLTPLLLVVYLYHAYLILSRGWVVGKADFKENPMSNPDLLLIFIYAVNLCRQSVLVTSHCLVISHCYQLSLSVISHQTVVIRH